MYIHQLFEPAESFAYLRRVINFCRVDLVDDRVDIIERDIEPGTDVAIFFALVKIDLRRLFAAHIETVRKVLRVFERRLHILESLLCRAELRRGKRLNCCIVLFAVFVEQ